MEKRKIEKHNKGFTLIEVVIAITIFSVFVVAYMSQDGDLKLDFSRMGQEILLKDLAENKLNEIIIDPPAFSASLAVNIAENKPFKSNPDYEYLIRYRKFKIPDLGKLMQKKPDGEDDYDQTPPTDAAIKGAVMKRVKKAMEDMIWQVSVEVRPRGKKAPNYTLSTWLYNQKAVVDFGNI